MAAAALVGLSLAGQAAAGLSDAQQEAFLRTARVLKSRETGKGVTASIRATLSDGTRTHDAHIQTVDIVKADFMGNNGRELNFRDNWRFNIAAYRIDRLLGLHIVPVSVERTWESRRGAFTWWLDGVLMDEGERMKKKTPPPDARCWSEQARMLRLLDALIDNSDRNIGNTLITKDWRIWAIDHTRAFRYARVPRTLNELSGIDRSVFARLEALDFDTLKREVDDYISDADINNVLARRDAIVERIRKIGDVALFDRTCFVETSQAASAR